MAADNTHSPMFDQLGVWILEQGISEAPVEKIISGFGRGLVAGGIALHRISLGGMLLHPVFGALDVVWDAQDDTVTSKMVPREIVTTEEFQNSPFFWALTKKSSFQRILLDSGPTEPRFPLLDRLQDEGVTDYQLFSNPMGVRTAKSGRICQPARKASCCPSQPTVLAVFPSSKSIICAP